MEKKIKSGGNESAEKKVTSNGVHIHGSIMGINFTEQKNGNTRAFMKVKSDESWLKAEGLDPQEKESYNQKSTFHSVSLILGKDDKALLDELKVISDNCTENTENYDKENKCWVEGYTFHPMVEVSIDGKLAAYNAVAKGHDGKPIMVKDKDGKEAELTTEKNYIICPVEGLKLNAALDKENKESRNRAELTGTVAKKELVNAKTKDGKEVNAYYLRLANRYFAPGSYDKDGKKGKGYHEATSFFDVRINERKAPEGKTSLFEQLAAEDGIQVGDLITVSGRLHNNDFEKEIEGKKVYYNRMILEASTIGLISKKGEKKAAEEAAKIEEAAKPEAKETKVKETKAEKKAEEPKKPKKATRKL